LGWHAWTTIINIESVKYVSGATISGTSTDTKSIETICADSTFVEPYARLTRTFSKRKVFSLYAEQYHTSVSIDTICAITTFRFE